MYAAYTQIFSRLAWMEIPGSTSRYRQHRRRPFRMSFMCWPSPARTPLPSPPSGDYAANVEMAGLWRPPTAYTTEALTPRPRLRSEHCLNCAFLQIPAEKTVKAVVVGRATVLLLVHGDHEVNAVKALSVPQVKAPLAFWPVPTRFAPHLGPVQLALGAVGFAGIDYRGSQRSEAG